jgi:hypothetical protein
MDTPAYLWTVPVAVEEIPETGLHMDIEASAEVRAAVAKLAGLRDLPQLAATFDLTRLGASVRVIGQVTARVGQTCVVTLEPIENRVEEAVDLRFSPAVAALPSEIEAKTAKAEEEPPEPLVGGILDLGAVATEFLLLGIDPYPRKADAKFAPPARDDEGAHPFAALAALKNRPGGDQP